MYSFVALMRFASPVVTASLITVIVATTSCQSKVGVEAATVSKAEVKSTSPDLAAPQTTPRDDGWERMKECAERTDRAAKQAGWIEGQRTGNITVMGWQNHYSPKYGKCYLQVNYLNQRAETNPNVPSIDYELYDAFEEKLLSSCTDEIGKATAY